MTSLVVVDTTVWSNFAHAGQPRLVEQAFAGAGSPRAVLEEIATGVRLGYLPDVDWSFARLIELSDQETRAAHDLQERLGAGEAASIAVASLRNGLLLTDDRAARKIARAAGVEISGTLGVLAKLVDLGELTVTRADRLLERMTRAGYRSPIDSLTELL